MIDFIFIEFYIKKKYNQKVYQYFNLGKMSISTWRKNNKVPSERIMDFYKRESSIDVSELFKLLYP